MADFQSSTHRARWIFTPEELVNRLLRISPSFLCWFFFFWVCLQGPVWLPRNEGKYSFELSRFIISIVDFGFDCAENLTVALASLFDFLCEKIEVVAKL